MPKNNCSILSTFRRRSAVKPPHSSQMEQEQERMSGVAQFRALSSVPPCPRLCSAENGGRARPSSGQRIHIDLNDSSERIGSQ
jgi:hypothetical protein